MAAEIQNVVSGISVLFAKYIFIYVIHLHDTELECLTDLLQSSGKLITEFDI